MAQRRRREKRIVLPNVQDTARFFNLPPNRVTNVKPKRPRRTKTPSEFAEGFIPTTAKATKALGRGLRGSPLVRKFDPENTILPVIRRRRKKK